MVIADMYESHMGMVAVYGQGSLFALLPFVGMSGTCEQRCSVWASVRLHSSCQLAWSLRPVLLR